MVVFTKIIINILFLIICCTIIGCNNGPNTASVSGVVTIDGKPVEGVHLKFSPKSGERPSVGYTNERGEYTLSFTQDQKGCIPGEHVVTINAYRDPENESSQYLPAKYNQSATENTELNIEIKKGNQKRNFECVTQ
ncbi:MAG: carboxypeptidase-like regulatory domain-containing protein [Planctomycetaceae bacterium]|jgi:hypothetical protein|nr:carboxypeptidase-like regulatory domain-containing protein [Planctomycetaceae bacterium]